MARKHTYGPFLYICGFVSALVAKMGLTKNNTGYPYKPAAWRDNE